MATYKCPPQGPTGASTFSDNIVGLQLVQGGGLTGGNFDFTNAVVEKVNRNFEIGTFSSPISLNDLGIDIGKSFQVFQKNFKVIPNFDSTKITNFTSYGSLTKRFESSIINIINYFPASLEINNLRENYTTGNTADNITFYPNENVTELDLPISAIKNPFEINFTVNATSKINSLPFSISQYRNLKETYVAYVLIVNGNQYPLSYLFPSQSLTAGTLTIQVNGNPFSGNSISTDTILIRPNDVIVNEVFNLNLDEVDEFLLYRYITPIYTAQFQIPTEADNGNIFTRYENVTWPLDGSWNLDIRTENFSAYIEKLNTIGNEFDSQQTDLISRFYVTDAFQEFDTVDRKVEKTLRIYGRSFDESKKYIDALSFMNSVNYNVGNDIPSKLLPNLAETLGWSTNISPITNVDYINSVYGTTENAFPGYSTSQTIDDLNSQFYRNLILNSAYLYKSKGTRKAIDFVMNYIGAPQALIEFNENIYVADSPINIERFNELFEQISGGVFIPETPSLDPLNIYSFQGNPFTAYTSTTTIETVTSTIDDYPVDSEGYPSPRVNTEDMFFQKGEGWFEQTPEHRSPEELILTTNSYTGQNLDVQTQLEPFTYGQKYLETFRNFPFLNYGFSLKKVNDNKKSWSDSQPPLRKNTDNIFDAYYTASDDRLVLNVKNVDLFLNPAQALAYDVWYLSNTQNYPIPSSGLSNPYPQVGGIDWTFINPQPQYETFFEFYKTFWSNMVNVRNRQFSSDGKTSGYPTLQSLFWKYLTMYQDVGIQNNNFNYQNMIEYINGLGDSWIRLVEQFIPATTIWNTGTKFENSIFHRQKFVYRRQRLCQIKSGEINGPTSTGTIEEIGASSITYPILFENNGEVLEAYNMTLQDWIDDNGCNPNPDNVSVYFGFSFTINGVDFAYQGNPDAIFNGGPSLTDFEFFALVITGFDVIQDQLESYGITVEVSFDGNSLYYILQSSNVDFFENAPESTDINIIVNLTTSCL
jgi:hypothetical protein